MLTLPSEFYGVILNEGVVFFLFFLRKSSAGKGGDFDLNSFSMMRPSSRGHGDRKEGIEKPGQVVESLVRW